MRLGLYSCILQEGSKVRKLYGESVIHERHRHRYEINNAYRDMLPGTECFLRDSLPTVVSSRSSNCRIIPGSSGASFIRSSSRAPIGHIRCFKGLSRPPSNFKPRLRGDYTLASSANRRALWNRTHHSDIIA